MPLPPTGDWYMVIGLEGAGVQGAAQVFLADAATEEEAVAKVAPLVPAATHFIAQVVPVFDAPPSPKAEEEA